MLSKPVAYALTLEAVQEKMTRIQSAFDALQESLVSDTKSSAGDKHETSRAMTQLEQEKLSNQLMQTRRLQEILAQIDPNSKHEKVQFGSLVATDAGTFFISVGLGVLLHKTEEFYCIAATSPVGQTLLGKKVGDSITTPRALTIHSVT